MSKDFEKEVKKEVKIETKAIYESAEVEITPLRDFVLHAPPIVSNLNLVKGDKVKVNKMFLAGLKLEKVI